MKSATSLEAPPHDPARPNVLVVDDVRANLAALEAALGDMNCNLVFATSGNEALKELLRRQFAVMLLDVQMPEMDGYEVARYVSENRHTQDTPIIFVTATHPNEASVLRGYGSGAVDFLFKPIDRAILRSKVRVFLDLHAGRLQAARALAELEEAHRELQVTQMQLVQAAKMASLGELVSGIAHEINNPLAFSLSHLGTVLRTLEKLRAEHRGPPSAAADELWNRTSDRLGEMHCGLDRIRDLVLKLRTFSRLDEGERKLVQVRDSVDAVLMIFGHRLGARIRVVVDLDGPESMECMAGLFDQALANLISNAIDAMPDGGTLTVAGRARGDAYELAVSDTGAGIPVEVRERVLEPFFTTKPVGQGTGLGLSITYGVVKKHGGSIEIGDAQGGGARIALQIPFLRSAEGSPAQ